MPLTVLTDSDVRTLLHRLTTDDLLDLQQSLADALHYYSTSTEGDTNGCSASYQPLRTALKRGDGKTTLFMPASSNNGMGVKMVTLVTPDDKPASGAETESTAGTSANKKDTTPKGSLTLLDDTGTPRAILNAEEITAFRTALASTMLFKKRANVHDVTVFGAGKQAYWHLRQALLLRGPEIHHLNIINRDFDRATDLIEQLWGSNQETEHAAGGSTSHEVPVPRPKNIQILTPHHKEYIHLLKSTVRASSVLFCTTPSTEPLFPHEFLTSTEGRKKGRYIAAIGSYKPHMLELDPAVLKQNVSGGVDHGSHHHKHAPEGGAVVVDSLDACLKEAGEIIQAGLGGEELVELGELVMLRREAEERRKVCLEAKKRVLQEEGLDGSGVELGKYEGRKRKRFGGKLGLGKLAGGKEAKVEEAVEKDLGLEKEKEVDRSLMEWLQKGNVIFKCVGMGMMDVVVGMSLVRLADGKGVGTRVENF